MEPIRVVTVTSAVPTNNCGSCMAEARRLNASTTCYRNPFGAGRNSNSNGGCHTALSTSQGTQLIAATVVVAVGTVGTLGLGDMIAAGIDTDLASGTLLVQPG